MEVKLHTFQTSCRFISMDSVLHQQEAGHRGKEKNRTLNRTVRNKLITLMTQISLLINCISGVM